MSTVCGRPQGGGGPAHVDACGQGEGCQKRDFFVDVINGWRIRGIILTPTIASAFGPPYHVTCYSAKICDPLIPRLCTCPVEFLPSCELYIFLAFILLSKPRTLCLCRGRVLT